MRSFRAQIILIMLLAAFGFGQEPPNWAKHDYAAPADQVFAAALKSIQAQHHEVKSKDDATRTVDFHVGITAWSWGYTMKLTVTSVDETHSHVVVGVSRSGGEAVSWGSGKKEVGKIFSSIDTQLASPKADSK